MRFLFVHIIFILAFFCSYNGYAQDGGDDDEPKEVKVNKMKQARGVSKSDGRDALYSSSKSKGRNEKRELRRKRRRQDKTDRRDYKKLRKKQQNVRITHRMRRNERKSNRINRADNVPFFKRIFNKKSTEKDHKKKDHTIKRKRKQKKIKNTSSFSRKR